MSGGRTGIVVPVPPAEALVGPWRWRHDAAARQGVPAHVTLLFPFRPADVVDQTLDELAEVFGSVRCQPFRLAHVGVFPGVTWLAPEPAAVFRDLTMSLVERFSDCPPYGGAFTDPVPHLTVIDHSVDGADASAAHAEFLELAVGSLPIDAELAEILLLEEDAAGQWSTHTTFALDP